MDPSNYEKSTTVFSALLKYWREARGLTQLDLSFSADVSAKHISHLETGKAKPSQDMVLNLASALQVPLREQNTLLQAAGLQPIYEENTLDEEQGIITEMLDRMLVKHEPYPMYVLDATQNLIKANNAGLRILAYFIADPSKMPAVPNLYEAVFDPNLIRPFIVNWESIAHLLVARIYRESLLNPHDPRIAKVMNNIFEYPNVPQEWRVPDLSIPSSPVVSFHLKRDDLELTFTTTITTFSAPQSIAAQEIKIECLFPMDEATEKACENLAGCA